MGIKGLKVVLGDHAPKALRTCEMSSLFGRKIAIDASTSLYQFLVAVRSNGQNLTTSSGEVTSHLIGMFYRTISMVESGLKPLYVFDGKPPEMKGGELAKRRERRELAEQNLKAAEEAGNQAEADKQSRRLVKVTPEINNEAKRLLALMGIPYVTAPCEAEAECAALAKAGKVWAAASQDMDTLCFGAPVLLRNLTAPAARKLPIEEIHLDEVLAGLGLSLEQLVDMGILLGCDYCDSVRGVGPKSAYALIEKHRTIEEVLCAEKKVRDSAPEDWPYKQARALFAEPEVAGDGDFAWTAPDIEGLVGFLAGEKEFSEERVRAAAAKLAKGAKSAQQGRIDSFFSVKAKSGKRKAEPRSKGRASGAAKRQKGK